MDSIQLRPLEVNPQTGEPFLRLTSHKNIILTPPRLSDGEKFIGLLNDERVYPWLSSVPHPYLPEHAEWWINQVKPRADRVLAELEAARNDPVPKIVNDCPVRIIREVKDDGTDVYLGDVYIDLAAQPWELEGSGKEEQTVPLRNPSNPDIWTVGDYLAPSHHRQGIMSDAFLTVLHKWYIPRVGVRRIVVTTLEGNEASAGMFQRNGFKFRKTVKGCVDVRGTLQGVHVLEWNYEEESS